jgi:Zn-dependent protease
MEYLFLIAILILSIVIHEVSHGAAANYLGDPTAKYAGRLTLNPIRHLDPIGSVLVPLFLILAGSQFLFGWAKPVPINPYNFNDQKYGSAKVALAGPSSNLAVALVFGLTLRFLPAAMLTPGLVIVFSYIVFINILLAMFNLLPIPPLDGSHILFTFLPQRFEKLRIFLAQFGIFVLIFLILFLFPYLLLLIRLIFYFIVGFSLP